MHGTNPIRPPEQGDGTTLDIQHIFATLQGEGPYAGWPAVFVRLGGCNLACRFCDTEFESFSARPVADIVKTVQELSSHSSPPQWGWHEGGATATGQSLAESPIPNPPPEGGEKRKSELVVITGGEPLRQPIAPLCDTLISKGYKVQLETNGTFWRELPAEVEIICSPKNTGKGYFPIRPDVLARVNAFKFIISANQPDYSDVAEIGQGGTIPVYVQPMDEYDAVKNAANLKRATEIAMANGYRLSLQLHKIARLE